MRVGLYARVSTEKQSVAGQLEQLRAYAERRGLDVTAEYVDVGVSGRTASRPGLDALLEAARRRELDAIVCVRLDRVFRSVRHLTTLAAELEAIAVALVVTEQQFDTSTPVGRLMLNLLATIGEFEADLIRERVCEGLERAKRRPAHRVPGKPGRPGRPFARVDVRGVLRMKEQEALSEAEACRRAGVSRSTFRRACDRMEAQ